MRLHRVEIVTALAVSVLMNACTANWRPATVPDVKQPSERTTYEIRLRTGAVRLHGVQFGADSMSGIPWIEHLSCKDCRKSYAYHDVVTARIGNPGAGAWAIAGPMLGITAFLIALAQAFRNYD